jgi:acetyl esterase/lipase
MFEHRMAADTLLVRFRMPTLLLVLTLTMTGCRGSAFMIANAPNRFAGVDMHLDLAYGENPRQRLDVISPRNGTHRLVVVFWYGGSWSEGDKASYRFVGVALARRGFVAVIPDYRLYPEVTFPAFDQDGASAVAWVEKNIADLGGDPSHIVLMGHSAGGHTAAFLAMNHEFLRRFGADPVDIAGLVGLSGTYSFVPDSPMLRAAFPAPYTEKDWQPVRFVDSQAPPTLLLHGEDDTEVLPAEAVELKTALEQVHVKVELKIYPHRGHADTVASFAPIARWRDTALQDTVRFLTQVSDARSLHGRVDAK